MSPTGATQVNVYALVGLVVDGVVTPVAPKTKKNAGKIAVLMHGNSTIANEVAARLGQKVIS